MPVWHERTRELRETGRIRTVGIIQEQHPDRARLFMQWKGMDWPILVDSLDLLDVSVVPITVLIDEAGIVRKVGARASDLEAFLADEPAAERESPVAPARRPDLEPPAAADGWLRCCCLRCSVLPEWNSISAKRCARSPDMCQNP